MKNKSLTLNVMEAGVDRDKVKDASDKVWAVLGEQAAGQLKPILGDAINISALEQSGAIAEEVHGIEATREASESEIHTKFMKCPFSLRIISLAWISGGCLRLMASNDMRRFVV